MAWDGRQMVDSEWGGTVMVYVDAPVWPYGRMVWNSPITHTPLCLTASCGCGRFALRRGEFRPLSPADQRSSPPRACIPRFPRVRVVCHLVLVTTPPDNSSTLPWSHATGTVPARGRSLRPRAPWRLRTCGLGGVGSVPPSMCASRNAPLRWPPAPSRSTGGSWPSGSVSGGAPGRLDEREVARSGGACGRGTSLPMIPVAASRIEGNTSFP